MTHHVQGGHSVHRRSSAGESRRERRAAEEGCSRGAVCQPMQAVLTSPPSPASSPAAAASSSSPSPPSPRHSKAPCTPVLSGRESPRPQAGGNTRHGRCAPQSRRHACRRETPAAARPARARAGRRPPAVALGRAPKRTGTRGAARKRAGRARARSRTSVLRAGSCCRTGRRRQRRSDGTGDEGEVAHIRGRVKYNTRWLGGGRL